MDCGIRRLDSRDCISGVFIYMSRRTDRLYKAELDRVSTERNKLQEQLTGESVAHSRKRKT